MNYREIKELIDLMRQSDVAEVEIEKAGTKIRVRREPKAVPQPLPVSLPAPPPAAEERPPAEVPEPAPDGAGLIISPLVGTFYRSPGPDSKSFVEIGDRVEKGQVLCIIEAMKLMNEIEAEHGGVVREILAENGQPVEYGQPLFRVEADS